VDRGELEFRAVDDYAPRLEANARAYVRGYDLTVRATGVLPDVDLSVTSSPPLPREHALLLLATGSAPGDLPGGAAGMGAVADAGALAGSKLLQTLSDDDDDDFLDRFTFETWREGEHGGQTVLGAEYRFSPRWFLRVERDRYDDVNLGVVRRFRFR
ncbi:MAG TPA: translocation/assembly module TamB domain-containing protein, partial [Planctomycetota bacterium]|nr:translocation/assembly module TamB domain-containing protein [Planctomycetota bacterium]